MQEGPKLPGTTAGGSTPPSDTNHQPNGRTTTVTPPTPWPHNNGVRPEGGTPHVRAGGVGAGDVKLTGPAIKAVTCHDITAGPLEDTALLIVGTFTEDLALVKQVLTGRRPGLVGCVAAGLLEFGNQLGPASGGIGGPAQWISQQTTTPEIGAAAADFRLRYQRAYGEPPGYVAAQAAAAGFLSAEAHRRGYQHDQVRQWRTTTLFANGLAGMGFAVPAAIAAKLVHPRPPSAAPR